MQIRERVILAGRIKSVLLINDWILNSILLKNEVQIKGAHLSRTHKNLQVEMLSKQVINAECVQTDKFIHKCIYIWMNRYVYPTSDIIRVNINSSATFTKTTACENCVALLSKWKITSYFNVSDSFVSIYISASIWHFYSGSTYKFIFNSSSCTEFMYNVI